MKTGIRFCALALFAAILALPLGSFAQEPSRPASPLDRDQRAALRSQLQALPVENLATAGPLSRRSDEPLAVVIELDDAPATRTFAQVRDQASLAQATTAVQAQLARIDGAQQRLMQAVTRLDAGAQVIYRVQRVYNGVAMEVNPAQLAAIARLPGVRAIHPLTPKELSHTSSVPLLGAPEVWNSGGFGATGENIKIGIIDTGIDYIHTNFGGPGSAAAYNANDTTIITDTFNGQPLFPTARVVGGYDFVGDNYNASCSDADEAAGNCTRTPAPDPDPMDCNGHGTHVAGTAAGAGVNADGSTYTGPYSSTIDFDAFRIGPGMAPQADLYALRVFGCGGSTNVTDLAIEWAIDPNGDGDFSDRLDVINMSLGSDYGSVYDTTAIASDNAALAGVIVVAAAGNAGDTYYIVGSPSTAGRAISVAGSVDSSSVLDGFRVNTPSSIAGVKPASNAVLFDWSTAPAQAVTGTLVYPASQPTGCAPFTPANTALITGNIVLLDWTDNECGSVVRTRNAVTAGAIGAILIDNSPVFDLLIAGSAVIPSVSTPQSVGAELKAALDDGPVSVTLSSEYINSVYLDDPTIVDMVYTFSSRGPRRGDSFLKPDIAAPAVTVFSAAVGTGNDGASFNGTSMATPHIAGMMALLKELHPDWTVEELKALAMNNATNDIFTGQNRTGVTYGPGRVGAGRADTPSAAAAPAIAYNAADAGLVSVSFGAVEVITGTTFTASKPIRVVNKSNAPVTYNLSYDPRVTMAGVSYSFSAPSVTLDANSSTLVTVTLTANPAQMGRGARDPSVEATVNDLPRHWLGEAAGYVTLTRTGDPPDAALRVPVHAAPRLASAMRTGSIELDFGRSLTGTATISLTGQGINTTNLTSLVTAFELQLISPQTTSGYTSTADLQYVGITSDLAATATVTNPTGVISETTLFFGIASYGDWSTPTAFDTEFDIYIDTDGGGVGPDGSGAEFVLFNFDLGGATTGDGTDVFVTLLVNLETGEASFGDFVNIVPATVDTAPYNTNVMVLPVAAADLGLSDGASRINYRVFSFQREVDGIVDGSGLATYDLAAPGLTFGESLVGPAYADLPDTSISVSFNRRDFLRNRSRGVLLLHHHNAAGERAEALTFSGGSLIYLPITRR